MLRMPLFIIIVAMIYFIEVLSAILQVDISSRTGGKRLFKMAPISSFRAYGMGRKPG